MTVYVESNFVIEIALGQEQSEAAESILEMAERGIVALAFPVIALEEPLSTVTQRGRTRRRLTSQLNDQIKELSRSRPHQQVAAMLEPIPTTLAKIEEKEVDLLISTVSRLLQIGRLLGFDADIFRRAVTYRARFGLSMQDAIVLATATSDLDRVDTAERSFFVSKNWKDFDDQGIRTELLGRHCLFINDFRRLLTLIRSGS